jgi:hypothetical protein
VILRALTEVAKAFSSRDVRYLVVGGVAVNAHGHSRMTRDLDLVLHLEPANLKRGIEALEGLGFRPIIPEALDAFSDPGKRRLWNEDRNMEAFSLRSDQFPMVPVDLLVTEPFDFDKAWETAANADLGDGVSVHIAGLRTLIAMKEAVGRPQDLEDARHLRAILEDSVNAGGGTGHE